MRTRSCLALCIPFGALAVCALFTTPRAALAHHGFSVEFDKDKPVTLTGSVTKFEFMNPHIYFYVDVKGKDGKVVNWAFEGGPPNVIYRQGWRKDTLKAGDVVTVKGFRAKDGSALASCATVKLPDGREVSAGSGAVAAGAGGASGSGANAGAKY